MGRSMRTAVLGLMMALGSLLAGCGGGGTSVLPITVSLSAEAQAAQAGSEILIKAMVSNDSSNQGVTWNMAPASGTGAGVLINSSSTSVTYKAPTALPASDVAITITGTAVADPSKSASVTITLGAVTVSVTTDTAAVGAGGTAVINAVVNNDPHDKGVTWAISPASGAGTLSNPTATSVTYNAPATPPANDVQVTITATSVADGSKSSQAALTFAAIAVSVTADSSVQAGTTVPVTAQVSFDPSHQGVTWAISPSTGAGTLSDATSTSVTYNAPATPPINDLTVTITATSVADNTKSGTAGMTVLAITVSLTPTSALIPLTASQQYTATVNNDSTNKGASWMLAQDNPGCSPACGTVAPATTASGTPTTYTAPATMPAAPAVSLFATSVQDGNKSALTQITLSTGTVKLVPASLSFGTVKVYGGNSKTLILTLTNTGTSVLTFSGASIAGPYGGYFTQANNCPPSVAAGASCTISVTFKPARSGFANAILSLSDSSADSPQQVPLSGTGTTVKYFGAEAVRSALVQGPSVLAPSTTVPSKVGTRVMELIDKTRDDPYLINGTKRDLLVRFWYPASLSQGCKSAEYTSPKVWSYFAQLKGVALPRVSTNSCWNAPMTAGPHPVVVFTHGYTGTFTDYTFLFEDLASRGYVVASVDHTYEATAVEFPDGRVAKSVVGSYLANSAKSDEKTLAFAVQVRLSDLEFVLNELERLNAGSNNPLADELDMSRVALAGHSLGGLTTLLAVQQEPRFRAGVILDGVLPDYVPASTQTPMLLLTAGNEGWGENDCRLWNGLRGTRLAVNLRGAEHVTPSDAVWLARHAIKTGSMGPEKTIAAVRSYVAAFLDANLRGLPARRLLRGPARKYRDAVVTTQKQSPCGQP